MKGAATSDRVLGMDGQFYTPSKNPEKHKREVYEAEKRLKIQKLEMYEEKIEKLEGENKDLKKTLEEYKKLHATLQEENKNLVAEVKAHELAKVGSQEKVVVEAEEEAAVEVASKKKK